MFRYVEFERVAGGKVYIVPDHVTRVIPRIDGEDDEQPYNSTIELGIGWEAVVGPPSEVLTKLQRGV